MSPAANLTRRIRFVTRQLEHNPTHRYAWDAVNAPLLPEPGEPVSVVLARRIAGGIVTEVLSVPRESFNFVDFHAALVRGEVLTHSPTAA
jgi:hypothetical protein